MKKYVVRNFTLVELLAAMAVFSILLMLSIRLFSGSQQIWLRSEQKTDTFASARTAMEYMASRMQTLTYFEDPSIDKQYPFEITKDSIWFVSTMAMGNGSSQRRFLKFRLVTPEGSSDYAGHLQMIKYDGQEGISFFNQLFPTYYESERKPRKITSYDKAKTHLENIFAHFDNTGIDSKGNHGYLYKTGTKYLKDNPDIKTDEGTVKTKAVAVDICENVIDLKFKYYVAKDVADDSPDFSELESDAKTAKSNGAPYLVEIELKMLDSRDSFQIWKDAAGDANKQNRIFLEHGYTFSRAVLLGKKGK